MTLLRTVLVWSLGFGSLCAQTPPLTPASPKTEPTQAPLPVPPLLQADATGTIQPRAGDFRYLPDANGQLVPVPANAEWQDFLEWQKRQSLPREQPAFSVGEISLSGTATDERATLQTVISVQLNQDAEWVRVPLGLQEAILRRTQYQFQPDEKSPAPAKKTSGQASFDGFDRQAGYQWWFRGKGRHQLTLTMIVPLKKQSGVRKLQLGLPASASSYLKLTVPVALDRLSLQPSQVGSQKTQAAGTEATDVEAFGLGQRLDLGWQTLPDSRDVKTLLQAETEIRVEPTQESILLRARQLIEPLQGSVREFTVTLPPGFAVVELKVNGEQYHPLESFPAAPTPLTIALAAPTTSRIRLDWILQAPWPASGQLTVEGFRVSESLRQAGEIAIVALDGYRIVKRSSKDVYRTNVRELLGPGPISSAYQFREQPFQLVLDLQEIEPSYSVRPHLFLRLGGDQVELLADLEFEIYRGVLQSVQFAWPQFEEEGWTIDRAELPGVVEKIDQDRETGKITFQFAKPLTQGSGLRLPFRASRPVPRERAEGFALTLPQVIASNRVRTAVVVMNQENVESTIVPANGTTTQPLSANLMEEVQQLMKQPALRAVLGLRQSGFQVRSESHQFKVHLVVHPQSITAETRVEARQTAHHFDVTERLVYHVKYVPTSQVRVLVPRSFPENVQFYWGLVPLPFEWTGLEVGDSRQARLELPEPLMDRFELIAKYRLPEPAGDARRLPIPLVRANDASEVTGRLEFVSEKDTLAVVEDSSWVRVPQLDSPPVWTCDDLKDTLPLKWSPVDEAELQSLRIPKALVRSEIRPDGYLRSRAHYQLNHEVAQVTLSLPPDQIVPDRFSWNGRQLSASAVRETQPGSGLFRLDLSSLAPEITPPETPSEPLEENGDDQFGLLSVDYHSAQVRALDWSRDYELAAPEFPGDVWIERTIWEAVLPVDHHLLTLPNGFTPQFSWRRQGLFWSRQSEASAASWDRWIGLSNSPQADAFALEGNSYRFSHFGPCPSLKFLSMNRAMLVLFGAGLALSGGFVLLKLPKTRNVLTVLLAAFTFALVGVWQSAPVAVLLQPAMLGLLLAIVGVMIDSSFKRRRRAATLPLPRAGEFAGSSLAPSSRHFTDPIGSEDPTAVRPLPAPKASSSTATPLVSAPSDSSATPAPQLIGSSLSEKAE